VHYHWNWKIFWDLTPEGTGTYLHTLLVGLLWTLATALAAWIIALTLGSLLGVLRTTPRRWAAAIGNGYVELFRNIRSSSRCSCGSSCCPSSCRVVAAIR